MELDILEHDLASLTGDITHLEIIKSDLNYNVNILKRNGIVASAFEYKKSVEQLETVDDKIAEYRSIRNRLIDKFDKKLENFKYYSSEYELAFGKLEKEKVILLFDPNKRKKKDDESKG